MKLVKHRRALFMLGALLLSAACSESSPTEPTPAAQPWTVQFLFGSTSINTGDITTNQDGVSANILSDFVMQSALPNVDLELFITHVYVPAAAGFDSRISNVGVSAGYTTGARTPDFFRGGAFVQSSTLSGQLYDVYRLEGLFLGAPALRPTNFANVVFTFRVEYLNASGAVAHSSDKTVEIYKR